MLRKILLSLQLPARIKQLCILYRNSRAHIASDPGGDESDESDSDWLDWEDGSPDSDLWVMHHEVHPDSDGSDQDGDINAPLAKHLFRTYASLERLELNLGHLQHWNRGDSACELWSCPFRRRMGN